MATGRLSVRSSPLFVCPCLLWCSTVRAARVSVTITQGRRDACSEVRLPRKWIYPQPSPLPPEYRNYPEGTIGPRPHLNIETVYRQVDAFSPEILFGLSCYTEYREFPKLKVLTESHEHYAVQLTGWQSRVKQAGDAEWDSADPILKFQSAADGQYSPPGGIGFMRDLVDSAVFTYKGHQLNKSGQHWEDTPEYNTRISGDGAYVAVLSYTGDYQMTQETPFTRGNQFWGQAYADIYEVSSGRRALALCLNLRGAPESDRLAGSFWLGKRYFVVPLGPDVLDSENAPPKFLFCDMQKLRTDPKLSHRE
jgi:hypothetical protein